MLKILRKFCAPICLGAFVSVPVGAFAVTVGQVDDFQGVDNVAAIPEPTSTLLSAWMLQAYGWYRKRVMP